MSHVRTSASVAAPVPKRMGVANRRNRRNGQATRGVHIAVVLMACTTCGAELDDVPVDRHPSSVARTHQLPRASHVRALRPPAPQ